LCSCGKKTTDAGRKEYYIFYLYEGHMDLSFAIPGHLREIVSMNTVGCCLKPWFVGHEPWSRNIVTVAAGEDTGR